VLSHKQLCSVYVQVTERKLVNIRTIEIKVSIYILYLYIIFLYYIYIYYIYYIYNIYIIYNDITSVYILFTPTVEISM